VNLLHYPWCRRCTTLKGQEVNIRRIALRSTLPDFLAQQSRLTQRGDMVHDRPLADFALISDVLVRRPALTDIAGIVCEFDEYQLAQGIADAKFHCGNHQAHAHTAPRSALS
jgi:hypothetical protein